MTNAEFLRRQRRLTQQEVAHATGMAQNTVSTIERGGRVDLRLMRTLAHFFGIPEARAESLLAEVPADIADVPPPPSLDEAIRRQRGRQ